MGKRKKKKVSWCLSRFFFLNHPNVHAYTYIFIHTKKFIFLFNLTQFIETGNLRDNKRD